MAKSILSNPLVLGGAGLAAVYLFTRSSSPAANSLPSSVATAPPTSNGSNAVPLVGINSGTHGSGTTINTVSNYVQLAAAVPNLLNPNYHMTDAENKQYLANYIDLQQGLPSWIGHKDAKGVTPKNINDAAQEHWTMYGCAEKRIFLPLQPPSTAQYIKPPAAPKSSGGGSWIGPVLQAVATVAVAIIGPGEQRDLNDGELQLLFTGGYVLTNILPFYEQADPATVQAIGKRFTENVTPYL